MAMVMVLGLTLASGARAQDCLGDCDGDGRVAVNELVFGVNIALGRAELDGCDAFDNGSGSVTINVLIGAVLNAVNGCGAPTPTAAPTATPTQMAATTFQGALTRTNGRFTYQAVLGIDGANAECAAQFAGAHACTIAELREAEAAGELAGVADTGGTTVTSFWAIDPARPDVDQCQVSVPWDYATAHTGQFADLVTLDNASGVLSALQEDAICATQHWVGCCL
jgi:hypothetical protein